MPSPSTSARTNSSPRRSGESPPPSAPVDHGQIGGRVPPARSMADGRRGSAVHHVHLPGVLALVPGTVPGPARPMVPIAQGAESRRADGDVIVPVAVEVAGGHGRTGVVHGIDPVDDAHGVFGSRQIDGRTGIQRAVEDVHPPGLNGPRRPRGPVGTDHDIQVPIAVEVPRGHPYPQADAAFGTEHGGHSLRPGPLPQVQPPPRGPQPGDELGREEIELAGVPAIGGPSA